MTVNFFVTIQHLIGQLSTSRISIKNQAIGYQIGCSATQTNFVAIECSPSVLDNDANVGFKDVVDGLPCFRCYRFYVVT